MSLLDQGCTCEHCLNNTKRNLQAARDKWAEEYLYDVKSEHQKELEEKLNQVFSEWIEKYGYEPRWFNAHNIRAVTID